MNITQLTQTSISNYNQLPDIKYCIVMQIGSQQKKLQIYTQKDRIELEIGSSLRKTFQTQLP